MFFLVNGGISMDQRSLSVLEFPKIIERLKAKAASGLGKERIEQLSPVTIESLAIRAQEETREGVDLLRLKGNMPLGGIFDLRAYLQRVRIGGILTAGQLREVASTILTGRKVKRFIQKANENHAFPILMDQIDAISELSPLEEEINECINEYGEIVDTATIELKKIRNQIRTIEARIKEKLDQMIKGPGYQKMLQEPIVTIRNGRYVIPVKQEYRGVFGGMVHDQSASGATLFIEPQAAVQMNNQLREYELKEEKEIEKILRNLSSAVQVEVDALQVNQDQLGFLDFIQAKAELATEMKATMPTLNSKGYIKLKKARHPLINAKDVVPIDVELGKNYTSLVITGPNTGGKTVTLKTIGLLAIMALAGLHIPVEEESEIALFHAIFADIGDEQSIEQSLSTFSSHLTNIIKILNQMDSNSLILLDELGAGTDPTEGAALAISILEKIKNAGATVIATTHYSELKAYAYNREGVINASVEFDVETLRPTYRLLIGVPGRSNAFAIAKRLGLSEEIIIKAKEQISEDNLQVESMIASLEQSQKTAAKEQTEAENLRKQIETLKEELENKMITFENQRLQLLEEAKMKAEAQVKKAKREAEDIISELRKMALEEKAGIKEHRLIEMKKRLEDAVPEVETKKVIKPKKNEKLEVGDEVRVLSLGQKGTILDQVGEKEYTVQIGILKMKLAKDDLERIKTKHAQQTIVMTGVKKGTDFVKPELDLRGQSVDEAMIEIDRYLDQAFLAGYGQVSIIHGKGTGTLRTGIQDFLRKHAHVKQVRLGAFGEGGSGVSIVELKR